MYPFIVKTNAMQKLFLSAVLIFTGIFSTHAQAGNSYLMMNIGLARTPQNYLSTIGPNHNMGDRSIGLQYIRSRKNNTAFRFGISSFSQNFPGSYSVATVNDTTTYTSRFYRAHIPRFSFGMEWQKQLHRDVMIYAGADAQLGMMFAQKNTWEYRSTDSNQIYNYRLMTNRGPLAVSAAIRPFVGMRANWSRFVFSYELSSPFDFSMIPGQFADFHAMQLKHTLSLGYMLKGKKH